MREKIYSLFTNPSDMTWQQILMNISAAAVLGIFIFVSYSISHRGTIYSKKFNASLVILAVLTGTVMTVIGNNIALSLGMVGALSIVRFRTAIKDSRDTVYIFWAIIIGICCGVGDYLVASIACVRPCACASSRKTARSTGAASGHDNPRSCTPFSPCTCA